jgi:hypothetical protein
VNGEVDASLAFDMLEVAYELWECSKGIEVGEGNVRIDDIGGLFLVTGAGYSKDRFRFIPIPMAIRAVQKCGCFTEACQDFSLLEAIEETLKYEVYAQGEAN